MLPHEKLHITVRIRPQIKLRDALHHCLRSTCCRRSHQAVGRREKILSIRGPLSGTGRDAFLNAAPLLVILCWDVTAMVDTTITIIAVVLIVAFVVALAACYRRWKLIRRQQRMLAWGADQLKYSELDDETGARESAEKGRRRANTNVSPADMRFSLFECPPHGVRILYPSDWNRSVAPSPVQPVIAQFTCPAAESIYKRFSIVRLAWAESAYRCLTPCRIGKT